MRFHLGPIPSSENFTPNEEWRQLREPSPWVAQLIAWPIGIAGFLCFIVLWLRLTNLEIGKVDSGDFFFVGVLLWIPLIVVHEAIHTLFHPQFGKSPHSILGFWPAKLLFYAHYDGELTRLRFILILAMPFVALTILPFAVCFLANLTNEYVAWISTWNALFACLDLFGIILLCFQVPSNAICRNQGWKTYWRPNPK
jgi:hypothetical protein